MKRRSFIFNFFILSSIVSSSLMARVIKPFELTRANKRKRIDKRWMHMNKSFDYFDYDFIDDMGFGFLRVLDDFEVDHLSGTPVHPHKDMEILTILLEGQIFHQDSMGNSGLLKAGGYQLMSAGKGLEHAETNPSQFDKARGLQIWISSQNDTGVPRYQQRNKEQVNLKNHLEIIASPASNQSMKLEQNAYIYRGKFDKDSHITYDLKGTKHGVYCFIIQGELSVYKQKLEKGDGLGIATQKSIPLDIKKNSDILLIEVPLQGAF